MFDNEKTYSRYILILDKHIHKLIMHSHNLISSISVPAPASHFWVSQPQFSAELFLSLNFIKYYPIKDLMNVTHDKLPVNFHPIANHVHPVKHFLSKCYY